MKHSRYLQALARLNSTATNVYSIIPSNEEYDVSQVARAIKQSGRNMSLDTIHGCLGRLVEVGLIRNRGGEYRKIEVDPPEERRQRAESGAGVALETVDQDVTSITPQPPPLPSATTATPVVTPPPAVPITTRKRRAVIKDLGALKDLPINLLDAHNPPTTENAMTNNIDKPVTLKTQPTALDLFENISKRLSEVATRAKHMGSDIEILRNDLDTAFTVARGELNANADKLAQLDQLKNLLAVLK